MDYLNQIVGLRGKTAIVTGASQGIGKGIAVSLAKFGAEVTIIGRNKKLLEEAKKEVEAAGGSCDAAVCDVADKAAVDSFFDLYIKKHDKLDIFVNNAGYTVMKGALDTTEGEMEGLLRTNYMGALFGLQRAAQCMKNQRDGNIVIVTSVNALYPLPSQGVYTTTKCALEGLKSCLAADLCHYNIRVNTLAPGAVNTNMNHDMYVNGEVRKEVDKMIPLGHVADIEEMGDVCACMVSDAFRYMTGATVLVDGGLGLRIQ